MSGLHQHQWDSLHHPSGSTHTHTHALYTLKHAVTGRQADIYTQIYTFINASIYEKKKSCRHACVWEVTQITYCTNTQRQSLPRAYVIFSGPLELRAVLVHGEEDLGKHPADTLAPAGHDTEPPPRSQYTSWGLACAIWDYHETTSAPHCPPTVFQKNNQKTPTPTQLKGLAVLQGRGNARRHGWCRPVLPSC